MRLLNKFNIDYILGGYDCFCLPGYFGTHCEMEINECHSSPCNNGGHCLDVVNNYTCRCPPGKECEDPALLVMQVEFQK